MGYHEDEKGLVQGSEVVEEPPKEEKRAAGYDRARFLKQLGGTLFASLFLPGLLKDQFSAKANNPDVPIPEIPELPEPAEDEDILVRMMREVQRALAKPVDERHWIMVIDTRKCVGCHACTASCNAENHLPPGVVYRPVIEEEIGEYPNVTRRFIPRPCMQCDNPPCTPVCPVNATFKRPDGIVAIDYDRCIGCRYCLTACPYQARSFDWGEHYTEEKGLLGLMPYEVEPNHEYGKEWTREGQDSPIGNARKCHFCLHRVEKGLLPECVVTCIGRATFFGDKNDPNSLVSELIASNNVKRLKEELGTEPSVYYLI